MKSIGFPLIAFPAKVAPLAGAWIEILKFMPTTAENLVAPLAGAWIEMWYAKYKNTSQLVAPLAGAWIEMITCKDHYINVMPSLPSRERGLKYRV